MHPSQLPEGYLVHAFRFVYCSVKFQTVLKIKYIIFSSFLLLLLSSFLQEIRENFLKTVESPLGNCNNVDCLLGKLDTSGNKNNIQ